MKRSLIWFAILVSPILAWCAFTDSGRASWHSLISPAMRTTGSAVINVESSPKDDDRSMPGQVVLIPAQPAPTEPSLRVQMSGNRESARDKWALGLVIIDLQGRRSGIDTLKESVYQEIPNSRAERIANRGNNGNGSEAIVVTIQPAVSTAYSLEIAGKQAGEFRLAVGGVSPALKSITEIVNGRVPADTSVHYQVDLTKIRSLPFPGNRNMTARVADPAEAFVSQPEERVRRSSDPAVLAAAAAVTKDPCGYFRQALKAVPHEKLTRIDGDIHSLWDGKKVSGCEVMFVTNDALRSGRDVPDFTATEGTKLYRLGWRTNNSLAADGPGSGIFGIENESVLCLVSHDQPAELDEKTGKITQSETLTLTIQCRQK
jgi:hypothetical protein